MLLAAFYAIVQWIRGRYAQLGVIGPHLRWACLGWAFLVLLIANGNVAAAPKAAPAPNATLDQCETGLESQIASATNARRYQQALAAARELKQAARARFGENSRCYADALAREAVALQLLERPAEAGPLFEQSLALFRKIGPDDDPKLTLTLNNFGVHRFQLRQYQDAARLHEEALELRRNRRPLDEHAVAESLHNLAD